VKQQQDARTKNNEEFKCEKILLNKSSENLKAEIARMKSDIEDSCDPVKCE